jgi:NAD(P)-dependent dehydrogenase (short-subunit alcohol dehydrogenase family)
VAVLRADGVGARVLEIDVADDASVAAAVTALARETNTLDILVNLGEQCPHLERLRPAKHGHDREHWRDL